ncbi:SHOCT domain-containing protein [Candidatus Pelagibacter bacterium]|nr:SHOCT domain-containing protein [Candidatus Pelagibacter bacterium]
MIRLLIIIFFSFNILNKAEAKIGEGELKFSEGTMIHFIKYLYGSNDKYSDGKNKKNNPYMMVVSKDGNWSYYFFCPYTITQCADSATRDGTALGRAISSCEKGSGGSPCYLFATIRKINWNNGTGSRQRIIPKKLLKDPYALAQKIQELGFYDGDITQLPAINYETGLVDESRKITGEEIDISSLNDSNKKDSEINKKKLSDNNDTDDVVTQLKELNDLYKSGVLTKDEFDKAKKKLLK